MNGIVTEETTSLIHPSVCSLRARKLVSNGDQPMTNTMINSRRNLMPKTRNWRASSVVHEDEVEVLKAFKSSLSTANLEGQYPLSSSHLAGRPMAKRSGGEIWARASQVSHAWSQQGRYSLGPPLEASRLYKPPSTLLLSPTSTSSIHIQQPHPSSKSSSHTHHPHPLSTHIQPQHPSPTFYNLILRSDPRSTSCTPDKHRNFSLC